eukprot:16464-Heterococcus_DN1.PRE.3
MGQLNRARLMSCVLLHLAVDCYYSTAAALSDALCTSNAKPATVPTARPQNCCCCGCPLNKSSTRC